MFLLLLSEQTRSKSIFQFPAKHTSSDTEIPKSKTREKNPLNKQKKYCAINPKSQILFAWSGAAPQHNTTSNNNAPRS